MYMLRPSRSSDLEALLDLARYLDSPNLPANEEFLRRRLERSERSFRQLAPPHPEWEYQFSLVDGSERVVGTCAVISKHGSRDMPHLYLRVGQERRHAESVDVEMRHCTLQLEASEDGPSEIGALVLHPDVRGSAASSPERPARLLSWGRFAFVARHPTCFEQTLLAEMRASLDAAGRNAFWEAFGRRFTGMSYAEADRKSAVDKSFILDLFPTTPFYASLLEARVADQLGRVHPEAEPALRLLEQAGLHWVGEIDPFDAGPFFGATTSEIVPIRESTLHAVGPGEPTSDALRRIVSAGHGAEFRAVSAPAAVELDVVCLPKDARRRLGVADGDEVQVTPLPPSCNRPDPERDRHG
ncbi:MAG: arginine N-succinyltransferase [Deltaproteobacteria bacterium]|nr:arginine N-succinyltransferase [Deltaproteobacteria bacterium]